MERLGPFEIARPSTPNDAAVLLANIPGARLIAGGTDLIPNLRHALGEPATLVDLSAVAGLSELAHANGTVTIGAGVTLARLAQDEALARAFPAIAEAAATVGGNLCLDTRCVFYNQSEWWRRSNAYCLKHGGDTCHVAPQGERCHAAFSGDLAPVLLVLHAEVAIASPGAVRRIPLADLYVDDGKRCLTLRSDELVVHVRVPPQPAGARSGYRKARARGAIDFPLAGVAARVVMDGTLLAGIRVAITGTNSRPFIVEGTDALIAQPVGERMLAALGKLVQKQVSPMRTTVTASNYRRQVAAVLAQRLVQALSEGA